jgi:hypothetical protein
MNDNTGNTGNPSYGTVDRQYGMRLAMTPPEEDGPVWMVNLMNYHEVAQYADGRDDAISGREADDRYSPVDVLTKIGAEVVFGGDVDTQLLGDSPKWDRVGIVKYPTRKSFVEMSSRADFQEKHVHKAAGMAETIVMGCQPIGLPGGGDAPNAVDWSEVPHPPTAEDGAVTVIHVIRFHPGQADTEMVKYQNDAANVAVPHGVRIDGWFGVEGTIIGDGRQWDQVRFNAFPSKAAFMAVVTDPARLSSQREHRETAIADTYTMIVRPTIDRLAESTRG